MNIDYQKVLKIEKEKLLRKCPECLARHDGDLAKTCRRKCFEVFSRYYQYSQANIPRELWSLEIGDFSLTTGDEKVQENRTEAIRTVRLYLDHLQNAFEKGLGMILYGGHGTGKSMLAACIMKQALSIGRTAKMLDFYDMTNTIRRSRFEKDQIDPLEKELMGNDFYCIENFGVNQFLIRPKDIGDNKDKTRDINRFTRGSDVITNEISRLMDIRHRLKLPTIITTYYEIEELEKSQDEDGKKILAALFGKNMRLEIKGSNWRKEVDNKNWEKNLASD